LSVARLAHAHPDFGSRVEPRTAFSVVTTSKAHNTIPICNVHVNPLVFARQKRAVVRNKVTGLFRVGPFAASANFGIAPNAEKLDNQKPRAASFLFVRRSTQSYDEFIAAVPLRPRLSMMRRMINMSDIFSIGETQGRVPHRVTG
jgi:hypothetical protein